MGGGDRDRGRDPRHRRLRPAERPGVEGQHQEGARDLQEPRQAAARGINARGEVEGGHRLAAQARQARRLFRDHGLHRAHAPVGSGHRRDTHRDPRQDEDRHDLGLRASLPPLHRPAAQGRSEDRAVPPDRPGRRQGRTDPGPAVHVLGAQAGAGDRRPSVVDLAATARAAGDARPQASGRMASAPSKRDLTGTAGSRCRSGAYCRSRSRN